MLCTRRIPSGSKLRNRFCLNADERERRRFDRSRAMETIISDTQEGDHLLEALPAVNGFNFQIQDADYAPYEHVEPNTGDDEMECEDFWANLDSSDNVEGERHETFDSDSVRNVLDEFNLFSLSPDAEGLNDAIIDIAQLMEDGKSARSARLSGSHRRCLASTRWRNKRGTRGRPPALGN